MKFLLLSLFFSTLLHAQEVTVPACPADHVLDQTGKVTTEERKAVAGALLPPVEKDGLGIYLVLLNNSAEEPPADVARRLVQNWKGTADRVVVLSAPDLDPPLVIETSGVALDSVPADDLQALKDTALAEGAKSGPGIPAMLAAAQSVISGVREFRKGGPLAPAPPPVKSAPESDGQQLVAWVAGGALACCLLALFILRRGRDHALIFPQTPFRQRFSAPHSGGNNALVSFAKAARKE